jgi:hypothetical protein
MVVGEEVKLGLVRVTVQASVFLGRGWHAAHNHHHLPIVNCTNITS